ncbi:MAG TPA: tripartite tricarboxylate transporter substrate-binding protein, partial [Burkholderiales bacterium]|nr:tripartite tricarboxylate transporter substrate-binding protein [Burkholderiales bacterium]
MTLLRTLLFLLSIFAVPSNARAQSPSTVPAQVWPVKPVRIVSPFAPGGGNDTLSRVLAASLTPRLGQQVVVENRPGANTIVGTELVVKSPP